MKQLSNNVVEVPQDGLTLADIKRILKKRGDDKVHCVRSSGLVLGKGEEIAAYRFEVHTDRVTQ